MAPLGVPVACANVCRVGAGVCIFSVKQWSGNEHCANGNTCFLIPPSEASHMLLDRARGRGLLQMCLITLNAK